MFDSCAMLLLKYERHQGKDGTAKRKKQRPKPIFRGRRVQRVRCFSPWHARPFFIMEFIEALEKGALLTPAQAAAKLGVCEHTIRNWIRAGQIHALKVGGRWKIILEAQDFSHDPELLEPPEPEPTDAPLPRSAIERQIEIQDAERKLKEFGI